jgi:hypothetical protein
MDRFVRLRDRHCTAPGCRRSAWNCDLDHARRHPDGPTCPCNLHPLCRRHHRMKHETPTRVERRPDGTTVWTYPTGHVYVVPPTRVLDRPRVRARTRVGAPVVDPDDWSPSPGTDHGAADVDALTEAVMSEAAHTADPQLDAPETSSTLHIGPPPF